MFLFSMRDNRNKFILFVLKSFSLKSSFIFYLLLTSSRMSFLQSASSESVDQKSFPEQDADQSDEQNKNNRRLKMPGIVRSVEKSVRPRCFNFRSKFSFQPSEWCESDSSAFRLIAAQISSQHTTDFPAIRANQGARPDRGGIPEIRGDA